LIPPVPVGSGLRFRTWEHTVWPGTIFGWLGRKGERSSPNPIPAVDKLSDTDLAALPRACQSRPRLGAVPSSLTGR